MTRTLILASCFAASQAFAGPALTVGKGPVSPPFEDPCASPISYSNIGAHYFHTEYDNDSVDGIDGAGLKLEYSPLSNFFLTGSFSWGAGDSDLLGDTEAWTASAGLGGYISLLPNLDAVVDGGAVFGGIDTDYGNSDDSGWYIRPHLRTKIHCLEIHAGAQYVDFNDSDQQWEGFGKLFLQVAPQVDLLAGVFAGSDAWTVQAGVRYRF